jgi:hypothetical protein
MLAGCFLVLYLLIDVNCYSPIWVLFLELSTYTPVLDLLE